MTFRRMIQPLCWLLFLLLLIGGGIWGYDYFAVASWQTLDPSRLTEVAQTGAIYDKDGNFVTSSSSTNEWYMMWPNGNACELDIPTMPTSAGEYTLHVFFNGQLVATTEFKITE